MPKIIPAIILLFLSFIPATSHAQETSAPWPPDPVEIFEEGVEIVDMEILIETDEYYPPDIKTDNEARVVRIYDPAALSWREYPYIDEVKDLGLYGRRGDGTILFNKPYVPVDELPWEGQQDQWLLDPTTGEFSRLEIICDYHAKAPSGEGRWVYYRDELVNRVSLCNTETGEFDMLLPQDISWIGETAWPSLNGEWLILWAYPTANQLAVYPYRGYERVEAMYAYELATGKLNSLGLLPQRDYTWQDRWVNATQGIFYSGGMPQSFAKEYYFFDLAEPDSLRYATVGRAEYRDNPPRYEFMRIYEEVIAYSDPHGPFPDTLIVYFLDAQEEKRFELGEDLCGRALGLANGNYMFCNTESDGSKTLYELNTETGGRTALFNSDAIWLVDVSPDGRYAVVSLPNAITTRQQYPLTHRVGIIDLDKKAFIYEAVDLLYPERGLELTWNEATGQLIHDVNFDNSTLFGVLWNEGMPFLFSHASQNRYRSGGYDGFFSHSEALVSFVDGQIVETPIGEVTAMFPDQARFLVWTSGRLRSTRLHLYDIRSEQRIPILKYIPADRYWIEENAVEIVDDNHIAVTIRPASTNVDIRRTFVRYTIRIPG